MSHITTRLGDRIAMLCLSNERNIGGRANIWTQTGNPEEVWHTITPNNAGAKWQKKKQRSIERAKVIIKSMAS